MKTLLWLDDLRDPKDTLWSEWIINSGYDLSELNIVWVKNYVEFIEHINTEGLPDVIGFDHDLGESDEMTGFDCAKWLVDYCIDNEKDLPKWLIQSANPVGAKNISGLLISYLKFKNK